MKFLITESKLENVIFKYLDNQEFVKFEIENNIYFVNSEGDKYAKIRFNKNDSWCYISRELIIEISYFFSMEIFDSAQVISRWVESTLQMKVTYTTERVDVLVLLH